MGKSLSIRHIRLVTSPFAALALDPPVFLAPMAGITDLPFRDLVCRFGAGLVVSEMVASQEMVQGKPGVPERAALGLDRERTSVQIAGREAHWMAEAARRVVGAGARMVDINMGCPAKKVVNGLSGSALMREPDHALSLIEAVAEAVDVPVTLKMRLGWDNGQLNAAHIAARAESAGVRMIVVHGRTRCQFYTGHADWEAIGAVKRAVRIPVVANGDIRSAADARVALDASGADGVMIGRGVQGRPWLLAEIAAELADVPGPQAPGPAELVELIAGHVEASCAFYGRAMGTKVVRKHLGWYLDALAPETSLRRDILTAAGPETIAALLPEALGEERVLA